MRPIDANELYKNIVERGAQLSGCYSAGIARYMDRMLAHVLTEVDIAPTVDAVPVIRCKDCKFAHMTYGGECKYCDVWESEESLYLDGDFFCAFGERKDDE